MAFRVVATHQRPTCPRGGACTAIRCIRPPPDVPLGRVAATKQVAYVADIKETQSYRDRHPFVFDAVELAGYRSVLAVPMLKDKELVGSITILRPEVRSFQRKADRAGSELRRAGRHRRSRTRACSTSCGNRCSSRPPLPTCSRSSAAPPSICRPYSIRWSSRPRGCATRIMAVICEREGELYRLALPASALQPTCSAIKSKIISKRRRDPGRGTIVGRACLKLKTVHVPDVLADPEYT